MQKKDYVERGMVTDGWVSLDDADMGLFESVYTKSIREGEERLMLAVLESAVEDFQSLRGNPVARDSLNKRRSGF